MNKLLKILEKSVERYGNTYPLTLGHLINIIKLSEKIQSDEERNLHAALDEVLDDSLKYGRDD